MIIYPSQAIAIVRDHLGTDGLPSASAHTAVLWKNGATTAVTVTVTTPATGVYKFAWTMPADAAQGDVYSLRAIDADGYAATVWEGICDLYVLDGVGYLTSQMMGTISDAGTAAETYQITFGGSTYTLDFAGLDSTGNRTGVTRTKS